MAIEGMVGQIGTMAGTSAVAGGATGFATKKLLKIVFAVVALQVGLLAYLDHRGILSVEWSALDGTLAGAGQRVGEVVDGSMALATTLPIGVGFAGGFFIGFKRA